MRPYALDIVTTPDRGYDLAERLGFDELREALGVSVFDRPGGTVVVQALYATEAEAQAARDMVGDGRVTQLPETDWVALSQSGLPPIRAGRFLVHGSHDTPDAASSIPILVDAGAAFGTGHHGTTVGCLEALDDIERSGRTVRSVLDLGTGAGILAIAAAKLFPDADLLATDIDPVAVEVAMANAALNGVAFDCVVADGFDAPALAGRRFDVVVANILAGPLRGMAADIIGAVAPGGTAVLSGILDAQADWVAEAFTTGEGRIQKRPSRDGWTTLVLRKA